MYAFNFKRQLDLILYQGLQGNQVYRRRFLSDSDIPSKIAARSLLEFQRPSMTDAFIFGSWLLHLGRVLREQGRIQQGASRNIKKNYEENQHNSQLRNSALKFFLASPQAVRPLVRLEPSPDPTAVDVSSSSSDFFLGCFLVFLPPLPPDGSQVKVQCF